MEFLTSSKNLRVDSVAYRPEIDGLRAFAVAAVLFFHANPSWLPGGYVGVDVFFVISGYLITKIILDEKRSGRFSIFEFYERRARRILPALFLVGLVSFALAWIWMSPDQLSSFSKSLAAMSLFASNVHFWRESGYFDTIAEEKPLLHTWSLGVEEQYYLIFPLFVTLFLPHGRRTLLWAIFATSAVSLALSEWGWRYSAEANFYLLPFRAWELLTGSLLALTILDRPLALGVALYYRQWLTVAGLSLLIWPAIQYDKSTPFPSLYTLLPVAGAGLIIAFADGKTWVGRLLSSRIIVSVGLISYSAYLWHQPLFAFERIYSLGPSSTWATTGLLTLTIVLAYLTWRYVEKPLRVRHRFTRNQFFASCLVASSALIGLGVWGYLSGGFFNSILSEVPEHKRALIINVPLERMRRQELLAANSMLSDFKPISGLKKILIVGDSHGEDLLNAFTLNANEFAGYQFIYKNLENNCFPALFKAGHRRDSRCEDKLKALLRSPQLLESDRILYATRWIPESVNLIPNFLDALKKEPRSVVLIGRTAEFKSPPLLALRVARQPGRPDINELERLLAQTRHEQLDEINKQVKLIAQSLGVQFFDRNNLICGDVHTACDFVDKNLKPFYFDYGHWTVEGARHFGVKLSRSNLFGT